jgi:phosphoglycerate kinase
MRLPELKDLEIKAKRVVLRADLDLPVGRQALDLETNYRLRALIPTLDYLQEQKAQIILLGHRGRPKGKVVEELSLKPIQSLFRKWGVKVEENLRFNKGEEANDENFAKMLAEKGEVYVNEAFGVSHRKHASIIGLPRLLPHAAGLHFVKEVNNLKKIFTSPQKPVVLIIGGAKKDKLNFLEDFKAIADKILIAGQLPLLLTEERPSVRLQAEGKLVIADLVADKEDITLHSIEVFEKEIAKAGAIVIAGPMGKFENPGHRQGTQQVLAAVASSQAFKVAGGGETIKAINLFALENKFDWLSVGGGAMLEFLAKGTLPGIEALLN